MGDGMLPREDMELLTQSLQIINAPPGLIERIVNDLNDNSDGLGGQQVTRVGEGWFGGATNAHRIGVNTTMAHQAVDEEFTKLADALREYGAAIKQWANEVDGVDATTNAEMTARSTALSQVNTTLDEAREESSDTTMGDGSFDDPSTDGSNG